MSRFIGESTVYFIERVSKKTGEERLLNWDSYDGIWRPVSEFKNAEGSKDLNYLKTTAEGMAKMEEIKVQFGMVPEAEFEYNIIQKDDNSFRLDANGEKIPVETPEEAPAETE